MTLEKAEKRADKLELKDPKVRTEYIELAMNNKFNEMTTDEKLMMLYKDYKKREVANPDAVPLKKGELDENGNEITGIQPNRRFLLRQIIKTGPEVEKAFTENDWLD